MITAAAEATDCSKSQLISLPQMHERSHVSISARSVTVHILGGGGEYEAAIHVNIWLHVTVRRVINCAAQCVQIVSDICCHSQLFSSHTYRCYGVCVGF